MTAKVIAFPGCSVTELEPEAVGATVEQHHSVHLGDDFEDLARPDCENQLAMALAEVEHAGERDEWLAKVTALGNLCQFMRSQFTGSA